MLQCANAQTRSIELTGQPTSTAVLPFFALVFVLSIPFWVAAEVVGDLSGVLPINLPLSALMTFVPMVAALILTWREERAAGALRLLKRAVDVGRVRRVVWYAVALLFMPVVMVLDYGVLRASGIPLPAVEIPLGAAPVFFIMFFIGAVGEELGWQGYAIERLQARRSALEAALIVGAVWTLWHVIPFIQTNNSAAWIFWQCLFTMAARIITVWLYNVSGHSVFIAVLFHTMSNVAMFLFPHFGSHYDPFTTFWITGTAGAAVVLLWGPQTLARFRFSRVGGG